MKGQGCRRQHPWYHHPGNLANVPNPRPQLDSRAPRQGINRKEEARSVCVCGGGSQRLISGGQKTSQGWVSADTVPEAQVVLTYLHGLGSHDFIPALSHSTKRRLWCGRTNCRARQQSVCAFDTPPPGLLRYVGPTPMSTHTHSQLSDLADPLPQCCPQSMNTPSLQTWVAPDSPERLKPDQGLLC